MLCQNLNKCKLKEGMQKTHQNIVVNKRKNSMLFIAHMWWAFLSVFMFCWEGLWLSEEYFGLFEKSIFKLQFPLVQKKKNTVVCRSFRHRAHQSGTLYLFHFSTEMADGEFQLFWQKFEHILWGTFSVLKKLPALTVRHCNFNCK